MVSKHTGLITGLTVGIGGTILLIVISMSISFLIRRRNQRTRTSDEEFASMPSAPAAFTTKEQIDQAVEAKFAAEKASRMVKITAQPIDTISLDSNGHERGRTKVVETSTEVMDDEFTVGGRSAGMGVATSGVVTQR